MKKIISTYLIFAFMLMTFSGCERINNSLGLVKPANVEIPEKPESPPPPVQKPYLKTKRALAATAIAIVCLIIAWQGTEYWYNRVLAMNVVGFENIPVRIKHVNRVAAISGVIKSVACLSVASSAASTIYYACTENKKGTKEEINRSTMAKNEEKEIPKR